MKSWSHAPNNVKCIFSTFAGQKTSSEHDFGTLMQCLTICKTTLPTLTILCLIVKKPVTGLDMQGFCLTVIYILFFKYRNAMRLLGAILQDYEPLISLKTETKRTQRRVDECSVGNILHNIFIFLIYLN